MPTCIYCLVEKKKSEFNAEHVLLKSFGKFDQNLTLIDKVCKSCNQFCGDEFELAFARNTLAGIKRYSTGIKAPMEFHPSMARNLSVILDEDGHDKLQLDLVYSKEHDDIVVVPKPRVGFKRTNGEMQMFFLNDIPDRDILNKEFALNENESIYIPPGVDAEKVKEALRLKGINFNEQRSEEVKIGKTVNCIITEDIRELTIRAVYKMAFNYLAKFNSTEAMLHEMFEPARTFILQGIRSKSIRCAFEYEPEEFINTLGSTRYHTMCITRTSGNILGHVYIHPSFRYVVLLAEDNAANNLTVNFGHMFDLNSRTIIPFD